MWITSFQSIRTFSSFLSILNSLFRKQIICAASYHCRVINSMVSLCCWELRFGFVYGESEVDLDLKFCLWMFELNKEKEISEPVSNTSFSSSELTNLLLLPSKLKNKKINKRFTSKMSLHGRLPVEMKLTLKMLWLTNFLVLKTAPF